MSTKMSVNKMTKEQLASALGLNAKSIKSASKDLYDQIVYTDKQIRKDEKSVTKKDLLDMVKEAITTLGDSFKMPSFAPVAENSAKPKKLAPKKTTETEEAPEETPKKKPAPKKKAGVVKATEPKSGKEISIAESFSDEFELDGVKYQIAHDIKNMEDLAKAYENDETIIFAMYWSKRLLRQFGYGDGSFDTPKEFPLDLDIATCIYVSDEGVVAYAVSNYTEANYRILADEFEEVDGLRYAGAIEYQIYRVVA